MLIVSLSKIVGDVARTTENVCSTRDDGNSVNTSWCSDTVNGLWYPFLSKGLIFLTSICKLTIAMWLTCLSSSRLSVLLLGLCRQLSIKITATCSRTRWSVSQLLLLSLLDLLKQVVTLAANLSVVQRNVRNLLFEVVDVLLVLIFSQVDCFYSVLKGLARVV